ncbi:MAG: CRISPR-associated protein Cas4 [Deltaproteobacteria bacterium]|nr:MAG: CRISPR-associated protein Cas4 [Deltaproteobacteria bacterium]
MDDAGALVPIAALNDYAYCPRRCHYIYVEGLFEENEYTVEGSLLHRRVDEIGRERRGDLLRISSVTLYSYRYGLCGRADIIEERGGEIYPVEHKRGRRGEWENDQIQLCAQALCLEETLGREVRKGYLYYAASGRRKEIQLHDLLRARTIRTIEAVREMFHSGRRPQAEFSPRCRGCSLIDICLPREIGLLRRAKRPVDIIEEGEEE